jgi:hypothetical protein
MTDAELDRLRAAQQLDQARAKLVATLGHPIREYGCSLCQREGKPHWHREDEAIFDEHIVFQGKHSMRDAT